MDKKLLHLGTSGWGYKDWLGKIYEPGSKSTDFLRQYAKRFEVVEIDSTFYGTPRPTTIEKWAAVTTENFRFAPKVPQQITHEKRLQDCDDLWGEFIEVMSGLGPRLGPVVLQFDYKFTSAKFKRVLFDFLEQHGDEARLCVEVRHKSWLNPAFYDRLRALNIALVLNDLYYMPRLSVETADFVYIRLIGNRKVTGDDFSERTLDRSLELDWWAGRIRAFMERGLEVYAFANNHYEGHAPDTINELQRRIFLQQP